MLYVKPAVIVKSCLNVLTYHLRKNLGEHEGIAAVRILRAVNGVINTREGEYHVRVGVVCGNERLVNDVDVVGKAERCTADLEVGAYNHGSILGNALINKLVI